MPNVGGQGKKRAWPSGNEVANSGIALAKRSPYNRPVPNGVPETETHPANCSAAVWPTGGLGMRTCLSGAISKALSRMPSNWPAP